MSRLRHPYFLITASLMLGLLITFTQVDRPVKAEREADKRQKEGRSTPMKYMAPAWLWRGLRADLVVGAVLVGLTPLAIRRFSKQRMDRQVAAPKLRAMEWAGIAGALAIFAASAAPRLGYSLWGDEEYAAGKFVADQVEVADDGKVTITPTPWVETLWNYWRPTNHMGFTVLSRLTHDTFFKRPTGPTDPFMSETLIRLPTFLAGLASFLALIWACRVWGWGRFAVAIALAMAGHAWVVRFGVDARGYGIVVLLSLVLLGVLGRALQSGLWRWWATLGLVQFYLMWTYLGNTHFLFTINIATIWLIWRNEVPGDRQVQLTRWFIANLITLLLAVGMMAPMLVPFISFLKANHLAGDLNVAWVKDGAAYMACGAPWLPWSQSNPLCTALSRDGLPMALNLALLFLLWGVAAAGIWSVWKDRTRRGLLIFLAGGPTLVLLHLEISHTKPYHWYLIPFLPALLILWAAGLNDLWQRQRKAAVALAVLTVVSVHTLGWHQAQLLATHPIEANRESVALTRTVTNPRHPDYGKDSITACCIMTPGSYDPAAIRFKSVAELQQIIGKARQEKRPLYVNFGFRDLYKGEMPDLLKMFDDRALFEPVAVMPGLFFSTTREVIRLLPSPAPQ